MSLSTWFQNLELDAAAITDATADALTGGRYDPDLAARVYADQSGQQSDLSALEDSENSGAIVGPAAVQTAVDLATMNQPGWVASADALADKVRNSVDNAGTAEKVVIALSVIAGIGGVFYVARAAWRLFR